MGVRQRDILACRLSRQPLFDLIIGHVQASFFPPLKPRFQLCLLLGVCLDLIEKIPQCCFDQPGRRFLCPLSNAL